MMLTAYRLALRQHAGRAFGGEGARRAGGRWNPRGVPVVYVSATLSLAALEFLVHLGGPQDAPDLVFFQVEFEERLVGEVRLPKQWRKLKLGDTRALGRDWWEEAVTPVLRVPSFVVPSESNFVLNPSHPDFRKIKISRAQPFALDPRLYSEK